MTTRSTAGTILIVLLALVIVGVPVQAESAWFGQKPSVDTNYRSEGAPVRVRNTYYNSILSMSLGVEVASFDENYAYLNRDMYVVRLLGAANVRRANPPSVSYYSARANDYFFESSGITGDDMGKWFSLSDIGGFWYYGKFYSRVFVCSNGWAAFQYAGDANRCPFIPQTLPTADTTTTETPDGIIAPFWRDLNPAAGGQIGISRSGTGEFITIVWKQVANFAYSGVNTFTLSFRRDLSIRFEYGSVSAISGTKVGFEDPAGVFGGELDYNTAVASGGVNIKFRGNDQLITTSRFVVDKQDAYDTSDVLWDRNEISGVNVRAYNPSLSAGQQAIADIVSDAALTTLCAVFEIGALGCLLLNSGITVTGAVLANDLSKVPPEVFAVSDLGQTQRTGYLQLPVRDEQSGMWGTDMAAFDVLLWKVPKDSSRHVLEIQFGVSVDCQWMPYPYTDPYCPGPLGTFWTGVVLTVTSSGILFTDTFERNPWTPGSDPDSPAWLYWTTEGLWHMTGRRGSDTCTCYALHSAWYGKESTGNYNTGYRTYGALTSPLINIRSTGFRLDYDSWWSTEGGTAYDKKLVQISTDRGATWTTLVQISGATDAASTWVTHTHSLDGYVGKEILFRFYFDSVDSRYNTYEGWYVDRVFVWIPGTKPPT